MLDTLGWHGYTDPYRWYSGKDFWQLMLLGTQSVNSNGELEIGGCTASDLVAKFGSPLYVMDEAAIRTAMRSYRKAFESRYPRTSFYYASKAFLCMAMAAIVEQEGFCMDVAALGELYTVLRADFPPERIALHGNNKSRQELEAALEAGIDHIVLDNFLELELLQALLEDSGREMGVMVRATPGVDPKTHKLIRTGQADTKFGFNIKDGSAVQAIKMVQRCASMTFKGVHCHVGSQLLETETHEQAVEVMVNLLVSVQKETGIVPDALNIGGGLGVRYLDTNKPPSYDEFAEAVTGPLKSMLDAAGLPYPELQQEPGRAIVGEAGTTLYTVGAIKTVPVDETGNTRTYVTIDGGLSDNPRPQLYEAVYSCLLANRASESADTTVTIAGKHCETDILIWDVNLPSPRTGDVLAVQTTGAYNFVMASNYNRFLRPPVVLVNEGQAEVIVKRQTLDDLLRNEVVPPYLRASSALR